MSLINKLLGAGILLSVVACNNGDSETGVTNIQELQNNSGVSNTGSGNNPDSQFLNTGNLNAPLINLPGTNNLPGNIPQGQQQLVTTTSQPVNISSSASTPAGMNPPHGQPGHRCDIEVGAPLNSKPNAAATPAATVTTTTTTTPGSGVLAPTPQPNTPVAAAAKVTTPPGMNPPHGEPGHRCDISVGAPLNSKPTTPQATTTPVTTTTVESKDSTKN